MFIPGTKTIRAQEIAQQLDLSALRGRMRLLQKEDPRQAAARLTMEIANQFGVQITVALGVLECMQGGHRLR